MGPCISQQIPEDQTQAVSTTPKKPMATNQRTGRLQWRKRNGALEERRQRRGTRLIASFDGISNLVNANGTLYFIGEIEEKFEIWSSDGTASGTKRIDSIYPGSDGFAAYNLFAVDDTLFFSSSGPEASSNGYELWRWEGKDAGTKLFKNLFPDRYITNQSIDDDGTLTIETAAFNANTPEFSSDSFPSNFTNAGNGNFFFTAYSTQKVEAVVDGFADEIQLGGIELWFSNGTENGTYSIPINNESYEIYNPVDGSASPLHFMTSITRPLAAPSLNT